MGLTKNRSIRNSRFENEGREKLFTAKTILAFFFASFAPWRLKFLLPLSLTLSTGCALGNRAVSVKPHLPVEQTTLFPSTRDPLVLFLPPVAGSTERLWYSIRDREWFLEKEPPTLMREALVRELESMGFRVSDHPEECHARLQAEIRWFAPDGDKPLSAGVIVAFSLYGMNGVRPLWRGKLHGGSNPDAFILMESRIPEFMGRAVSEAIGRAMRKLRWDPTFLEAIQRIRGTMDDRSWTKVTENGPRQKAVINPPSAARQP